MSAAAAAGSGSVSFVAAVPSKRALAVVRPKMSGARSSGSSHSSRGPSASRRHSASATTPCRSTASHRTSALVDRQLGARRLGRAVAAERVRERRRWWVAAGLPMVVERPSARAGQSGCLRALEFLPARGGASPSTAGGGDGGGKSANSKVKTRVATCGEDDEGSSEEGAAASADIATRSVELLRRSRRACSACGAARLNNLPPPAGAAAPRNDVQCTDATRADAKAEAMDATLISSGAHTYTGRTRAIMTAS